MPLDFAKLARPFAAVVPLLSNGFVLNKKKYTTQESEDGWWTVEISGNRVRVIEQHYWSEPPKSGSVAGYTYNNDLVFSNFDVAKRKWKVEMMAPLHFNVVETFTAVRAVMWEDKRLYYCQPWYEDVKSLEVKVAYDAETPIIGMKGLTPELQTLHVFHALERQQLRALLAAREVAARAAKVAADAKDRAEHEAAEHERLMADVGYRLRHTFEMSGATLIKFSRSGNRLVVDWNIEGSSQRYNSVIDARTFQVLEAGYCMSGDDRRHNVTSMVLTAEDYEREQLTYITRR